MKYIDEAVSNRITFQIRNLAERLKEEAAINYAIADADPLGIDETFQRLPELNEHHDVQGVQQALAQAVAKVPGLSAWNYTQCSASIRDLCMLGASLVRFGVEPEESVPGFGDTLLALAAQVNAHIPRDSFIDYTSRNSATERGRTFTSLPQEKVFIESLRQGMSSLDSCLIHLLHAWTFPISHRECATALQAATASFQAMIDSIVMVKRGITPEVFTHNIRPFFEPFHVAHRPFSAPSGAEMPILNIDQIIWGTDCTDQLYTVYFEANIIRLPAIYQEISHTFVGQPSLMTQIAERLASGSPLGQTERASLQQLHRLLTRMYTFRMPHYKVAEENVLLRQKEGGAGHTVTGSSGFGLIETKYVLDQTIKCRQFLSQALSRP